MILRNSHRFDSFSEVKERCSGLTFRGPFEQYRAIIRRKSIESLASQESEGVKTRIIVCEIVCQGDFSALLSLI
jgi:hypothetical protein